MSAQAADAFSVNELPAHILFRRLMTLAQEPLKKGLGPRMLRTSQNIPRQSLFDDHPAVHEHDLVRDILGESHLMRHD
jgi:hypothetical protein